MTAVFFCTTIVFAIGWLKYKIATRTAIYYMAKKGYKQPNDKEIVECTHAAVRHMFKIK